MIKFLNKIHSYLLTYYNTFNILYSTNKTSNNTIMAIDKSMIWVTFRKEGIHCYPDAATNDDLKDVQFLGHPHRHIFHFKVWIEIFHDDREIEFILFKRWLEGLYNDNILQLDHKSCEMIACDLQHAITTEYPNREIWIELSEDGENGCLIKFLSNN